MATVLHHDNIGWHTCIATRTDGWEPFTEHKFSKYEESYGLIKSVYAKCHTAESAI